MKQILGILSVIIVLGTAIFVFSGKTSSKEEIKKTIDSTNEINTEVLTTAE